MPGANDPMTYSDADLDAHRLLLQQAAQNQTKPNTRYVPGKQETTGMFGQDASTSSIRSYDVDPNAFEYGGHPGGAQAQQDAYSQQAAGFAGRSTPQMDLSGANQAADFQKRALGQTSLVQNQLQNQIMGNGPSVAQQQLNRGLQASQMQAASTAASARGGGSNLASAQRMAAQQQGQLAGQANEAGAQLRAQEQMAATSQYGQLAGQYGSLAGQIRGQSAQEQQAQAGIGLQGMQLNQQGQLASQGMADQVAQQQLAAQMQGQKIRSDDFNQAQDLAMKIQSQNAERDQKTGSGILGGIASGIGSAISLFSDERVKREIQSEEGAADKDWHKATMEAVDANARDREAYAAERRAPRRISDAEAADLESFGRRLSRSQEAMYSSPSETMRDRPMSAQETTALEDGRRLEAEQRAMYGSRPTLEEIRDTPMGARGAAPAQMLDEVHPVSYNYRPGIGEDPARRQYGIIAQDLERSPMGASIVRDTPMGKQIDAGKAAGVNLAAAANLHDRLRELEADRDRGYQSVLAEKVRSDPYAYRDPRVSYGGRGY